MFPHVALAAKGVGSPLFNRDVEKVDRQDDNASVRLFSADTCMTLTGAALAIAAEEAATA
jgi:hypothetical protein